MLSRFSLTLYLFSLKNTNKRNASINIKYYIIFINKLILYYLLVVFHKTRMLQKNIFFKWQFVLKES